MIRLRRKAVDIWKVDKGLLWRGGYSFNFSSHWPQATGESECKAYRSDAVVGGKKSKKGYDALILALIHK
jgi:hypothetical protein